MLGSKPTRRYCRYCGSSVTPTDAFCSSCGKRLASREGVARDEVGAQPPSWVGTKHASFSRFWPASAGGGDRGRGFGGSERGRSSRGPNLRAARASRGVRRPFGTANLGACGLFSGTWGRVFG